MNEQLLKDFIATAQKYNYNWNKAFGLFPELQGYDQQLLKDYVATAEKNNYDYKKVNSLFPEFGFNQEPVKKKESTELASKSGKPTSASSSKRRFEGVTEEPISQKKVRTDDYIDQVQNAQKKQIKPQVKAVNTLAPNATEQTVDVLTTKEANQMMAEDFGEKEFEAYSSINKLPSANKLRDLDEETTADILNKQFEGTNLEFKKLGWQLTVTSKIGDGINSTILNEKTIDLSEPDADKKLKSFISTNLVKKSEREQFENAQSVEDLVQLVGSNPNKFRASLLEGMDVDSYFQKERDILNGEMTRAKADTYDSDLKLYEQKVIKFNQDVKSGKMTKADFDSRSAELENERKSLVQRRDIMSRVIGRAEKIDDLTNNLENAKVITAAEREKQGSLTGLVLRGVGEGLTDVSQAMIDFGIAGASAVTDAKTLADAISPGEYDRLKRLGFSDDEIKNEIQKSVKNRANKVLRSVPDAFGMGTTEEYAKSADRGIIEQAAYAIGESLGAVGGGIGIAPLGTAGTTAGFFSMSYNALEDQMRGPQFDALSENEKKIMSVPYGLVIGALEKLGAKVAAGAAKNKTLGMFSEYIMAKTFSSLPKNASLLEIKSAIDKSVALSVANGMLKITGAGVVEGGTEFTQQIFEGIEKDVANRIIQSNQLETAKEEGGGTVSKEIYNQIVQNKFFKNAADLSTTEGIGQLLKESGNAFLVGAVAGGMGSTASVGVIEPISNKVSNNRFAVYRDIILNDDAREGAISSINKKVEDNELTREQADEQIKSINESYPALRQIPTDFSVGAQREAFGLLMEREKLNKEIADKDPNLVAKQKERVAEINEQLKGLSYAVQEQATGEVSVQPTTGVGTEMEKGVSETKPEVVTGEEVKIEEPQAEVTKEEIVQSEENQALIDDYVKSQTEFINGATTISQEEKQQRIQELESDPVAYAENKAGITEFEGETPHTDLLNSLQRQPVVQETAAAEKLTVNPSEGYSFEYESENDVPAELKGVEPTGRTETKVGRGKNAKTKLKLTFTGQQLIDAGLAVTPEAQAEVVQPVVQETVQTEPTAKIETIEVQEVPQVEQVLDDLTQQNNVLTQNDFTAARIRNVGKEKVVAQIQKAAKAIAKVLPKVKIVVHATPEAFVEATKDMDGRLSEGGLYDHQTGEIHINLERANNRTVAHEVFHALILSMVKSDVEAQRLTRSMIKSVIKSLKKAEGTAELISYLEEFESNYDDNIKDEEKLGELFGILADNYKQLPPASKNIIIRFLNRLAKALGLKEMTDREAIAFMNNLSRKVEMGQEIEAREVGKQKEGKAAVRKQIIGEVGAKRLDQQENSNLRMDNLQVAKNMKVAGETPKQIRNATGWEMGAEGKWRYETVDNLPFFNDVVNKVKSFRDQYLNKFPLLVLTDKAIVSKKASDILPAELINMYPELNDYTIDFGVKDENKGSISVGKKTIRVDIGQNPINTVKVLLHEVQHAIQEIEGFDSGTNLEKILNQFIAQDNALKNRINKIRNTSPDSPLLDAVINQRKAFIDNFSTVNKNNEKILNAFDLYMRKAGEIEANNVINRMNMTEEERRNTLLTETESVKDRQIIEDRATGKFAVRKQKGDVVKSKINEDWEHTITLNGKEIGKIFYDKSQKTWNNLDFDRRDVTPYSEKWVYGDVVGENKQEAIDEMVRRYKEKEVKPTAKAEEAKIKYTNDQVTNNFLNALNEKSDVSRNPINNKEFIYGDKASLEFSRFDKGDRNEIAIQSISTFDKGKGVGKQVMKDITDTADELGVTLTLDAKPFGNEGLSKEQLINFYKKNGFVANIEEMFGGEFESEEELIDYVINEEPETALQMTREPSTRQFAVRKQKTTGPSRIVENGVKAGKTDAEIRQEGRAAGFTNKEMTEALSKYYTKEQGIFMKSGIKGKIGQFVDFAKKWKQKYLTTKGLLAKVGFTYKEKMEGEISAEANRAAKTAKKFGVLFDKFTGDKELLKDAFDKVLRGDKSIQLPAGFAALANEMRNHIDRLSQMLIATGAVEGDMADTIRKNMGAYITRSYEIFDNKNFRQKVGEQELQAAKNFLRTQPGMIELAKAEAARTGVTVDEALDALVDNKIDEYFADAETGALIKGSKLGSKDLSTLKERKEIPEQIRMLMGEYSDPAMNYARTVLNIATLAARHQFLTQVKEAGMGKFFFEKNDSQRPKGFDTEIAAEGSDTMSPLNGLMTTPEIAEAFGLYDGQKGEDTWVQQAIKIYYKAMGMVKWLKTIPSFGTHMKNVFSNFGFVAVNGHSLIEIGKAIKVVAQDLKTMSKPDVEAKIDEYIKAGIMRQGAGVNEIKDMFKDADMDDFLERRLSMRKPKGVMGKIKQVISSKTSKLKTAMEDLYQAEDDMFKIAAYETEMNRYADSLYNKSKDQLTDKERQEVSEIAANNVKNTYPTYSRIPEGIKRLRRFPLFIGSFISFQAESYRTAYNTIALAKDELSSDNKKIKAIGVRRVAGAGAYLTAKTALLSYAGYAAGTGIGGVLGALFDDDDEEKKQKDVRSFLPPWSQNSDLIILKAADGEIEYIDFSASDPHGGINKALNALLNGEDLLDSFKKSTLELVGQFQGPDILTNLAIQLKGNENDFGKPIYNEEDSFAEKTDKILDYVYKVVEPGTITSIRKAVGSEQSASQLAFGEATGLKIRKANVKEQFGYKLSEFDESFKDIRKIYNSEYYKNERMLEDPKATNKEIDEQQKKTDDAYVRANKQYAAKAKELMDLINSANRLGVDYDELIDQLETIKSTMGKSNIYEMEDGGTEFIKEK
jgi:hypothetical protein